MFVASAREAVMNRRTFLGALVLLFLRPARGHSEPPPDLTAPQSSPLLLGRPASVRSYLMALRKFLDEEWPKLTSTEERAKGLVRMVVNPELRRAKVPPVRLSVRMTPAPLKAQFESDSWTLVLSPELLGVTPTVPPFALPPALGDDQAAELTTLVYHEACHAEQFCLIARLIAAELPPPPTGVAVQARFIIADKATNWAARYPLPPGHPATLAARAWFANIKNTAKRNRDRFIAAQAEYSQAERDVPSQPDAGIDPDSPARLRLEVARAKLDKARAVYRSQPIERDAYLVSDPLRMMYQEAARP